MRGTTSEYHTDPVDEYVVGAPTGPVGYQLHRAKNTTCVRPGDMVVIDPEHAHRGSPTCDGPWGARLLVLPSALIEMTADEPPMLTGAVVHDPIVRAAGLRQRFLDAHIASERAAPLLERQSSLLSLLDDLAPSTQARPRSSGDPSVTQAIEFIRDTMVDTISLEELAQVSGSTTFRLLRRFRTELGITPHQFLVSLRIAQARRLLATDMAPADVAARCGFADQSHLNRQFRNRLGVTPGQYRRSARGRELSFPSSGAGSTPRHEERRV